ncbi:hypothetical protein BASA81_010606 [Batrachochytrium salamandrivorans]|nr:hypothetical protein BASA81_010606 [Batrachochytrium salamandrivorans]
MELCRTEVVPRPPPPGYKESFLIAFILCVLCVAGGLMLFASMRFRSVRLAKRSFALLALSGTAALLSSIAVLFREYAGRTNFACSGTLALHYLVVPLAIGPLAVKMAIHAFRLRKSHIKAGFTLGGENKHTYETGMRKVSSFLSTTNGSFTSPWWIAHDGSSLGGGRTSALFLEDLVRKESADFSLAMVLALCLPFLVAILVRALGDDKYGQCLGCDFEYIDVYILTGLSAFLCLVFVACTVVLRNSPDPLYVVWECKLCGLVFCTMALPQLVLYVTDPGNLERDGQFTWWVLETAWVLCLFVIQSYLQVGSTLYINRSLQHHTTITLYTLLENVELRDMFDEHLVSEFSIENLRFWDRAIYWKSVYFQAVEEERERKANELYRVFIQREGAMALNLSSANLRALALAFDCGRQDPVPSTVFDSALVECFKLMNDGLARFVRGDRYRGFKKTKPVDFEGDVLRNNELGLDIHTVISVEMYLKQFDELSKQAAALAAVIASPRRTISFTKTTVPTPRSSKLGERKGSLLVFMEDEDGDNGDVNGGEDLESQQRSRPISMQVRQSYDADAMRFPSPRGRPSLPPLFPTAVE